MITWELFKNEVYKLGSAMGQQFAEESVVIWFQDLNEYGMEPAVFQQAMKIIRNDSQYVSGNIINLIISTARTISRPETLRLEMSSSERKESLEVSEVCCRAYEQAITSDPPNWDHLVTAMEQLHAEGLLGDDGSKTVEKFRKEFS